MQSRVVLLFITLLGLALFVAASPVPADEAKLVKKALKQYEIKRGVPTKQKRDAEHHHPKPSKVWREAAPAASEYYKKKRDAEHHIKPSKVYRAAIPAVSAA